MSYYVYILTNHRCGTLYTGFSNCLERRHFEHTNGIGSKFAKKYKLNKLVYVEAHEDVNIARQRERNIKHWRRDWKIDLVNEFNPEWRDLSKEFLY